MKHTFTFFLFLGFLGFCGVVSAQDSDSVPGKTSNASAQTYTAIFYHGSDWCTIGERLKKSLWDSSDFQKSATGKFNLKTIDELEFSGANVRVFCEPWMDAKKQNVPAFTDFKIQSMATVKPASDLPNSYTISGASANEDVYTFEFAPRVDVKNPILMVTFPDSEALFGQAPGRQNGTLNMTHVSAVTANGTPITMNGIWASRPVENSTIAKVLNPEESPDAYWEVRTDYLRRPIYLLIGFEKSWTKDEKCAVKFSFKSKNKNHAASRIAFNIYDNEKCSELLQKNLNYERYRADNAKLWNFRPEVTPGVSVVNAQNKLCGSINDLEYLSPAELTKRIADIIQAYENCTQKIGTVPSNPTPEDAVRMGRALMFLEPYLPDKTIRENFSEAYEAIKKASGKEDTTGFVRRFNFQIGEAIKKADTFTPETLDEGEKYYDGLIRGKGCQNLRADQIQQYYGTRSKFYKKTKQMEKCIETLRAGYKLDPNSHIGQGCLGQLCVEGGGPVSIPYGWFPKDISAAFTWEIEVGTQRAFKGAGDYNIVFRHIKGKESVKIESVSVFYDGVKVGKSSEDPMLVSPEKETAIFRVKIAKERTKNTKIIVQVKGAGASKADSRGTITAKPILEL